MDQGDCQGFDGIAQQTTTWIQPQRPSPAPHPVQDAASKFPCSVLCFNALQGGTAHQLSRNSAPH